jgi:hypothetical protein
MEAALMASPAPVAERAARRVRQIVSQAEKSADGRARG